MQVMTSARYVLAPAAQHCVECAQARVREMDDFALRSPGRARHAVDPQFTHPFLRTFVEAFSVPEASSGTYTAVGIHDVTVHHGDIVHLAHCPHAPHETPSISANRAGYRPRPVEAYFGVGRSERDLSNPVTGVLSAVTTPDLTSLVTAKVSGFMVRYGDHGEFVRAWGGHCESYSRSQWVGLVEGIERICCAEPRAEHVLTAVPEGFRTIAPADFGLAPEKWLIPDPVISQWTPGVDLATGEPVVLPTRTVYYDARITDPPYVQDSSNGCAAGGTLAEAQLFGMLEVIERDAFLLAWYADLPLREIAADSIVDPHTRAYLQRLRLVGRRVRFVDATVGVAVPTVIAICDTASGGVCVGAGAHPDPERALQAALIEVASDFQVIEDHLRQRRAALDEMLVDPRRVRAVDDHADVYGLAETEAWLTGWAREPRPTAQHVPLSSLRRDDAAGSSVETDLERVTAAVSAAGFAPLAVDVGSSLSRRHGLECVKVIVPGLLPLDFGWPDAQRALHMPRLRERAAQWLSESGHAGDAPRVHFFPHPFP